MQNLKRTRIYCPEQRNFVLTWRENRLIFLILILIPIFNYGGNKPDSSVYTKLPIKLSFGTLAVGYPAENLFIEIHPTFSAGTEFRLNKNVTHRICQTLNVGFSFDEEIGNKVMVNSDFCYRYTHPIGIFAEASIGVGLVNQFHARETYTYNSTTGEYDLVRDNGIYGLLLGYGLGLGYDFSRKMNFPVAVYVKNTFFVQSPYFDLQDFPIMPQSTLQLGLTIKIRKNEK